MIDVIIVGSGLAGLNVAKQLAAQARLNIVIIEKRKSSKNNPLRLTFVETLQKFDLLDCAAAQFKSFGLISHHGALSTHNYPQFTFAALNYQQACLKLKEQLRDFKNISFVAGRAEELKQHDGHISVVLNDGTSLTANLCIDASGKAHFSQDYKRTTSPKLYSHSFGQTFHNTKNENLSAAWFIAGSETYGNGGGWYYPLGRHKASVGFAIVNDNPSYPANLLKEKFQKAVKRVAPINRFLKDAEPVGYEVGTIPLEHIDHFYAPHLLIIGDAAGQATPWMCMGVEPALENSLLASDTVLKAIKAGDYSENMLSEYQQNWGRINRTHYESFRKMDPKLWDMGEDVWDFVIEYDLNRLSPEKFIKRIRLNEYLMPKVVTLFRWFRFRLKNIAKRRKYKS